MTPTEWDMKVAHHVRALAELCAQDGMRLTSIHAENIPRPSVWFETVTGSVVAYFHDKRPSPWIRAMHAVDEYKSAMKDAAQRIKELDL